MRISDCSSDVCTSDLTTTSRGCPGAVRRYVVTPMPRTDLKAHPVIAGGLSVAITSPSAATAGIPLPALADRKSVVEGKSVSVRGDLGGRRLINNTITIINSILDNTYNPFHMIL